MILHIEDSFSRLPVPISFSSEVVSFILSHKILSIRVLELRFRVLGLLGKDNVRVRMERP